jgi:hypothetical protein
VIRASGRTTPEESEEEEDDDEEEVGRDTESRWDEERESGTELGGASRSLMKANSRSKW